MLTQHLGDLLHRLDSRATCSSTPLAKELRRPCRRGIDPEPIEVLSHQIRLHRLKIVLEQFPKLDCLLRSQIAMPLQNAP